MSKTSLFKSEAKWTAAAQLLLLAAGLLVALVALIVRLARGI
jgi:hypothetical protein